MRGTILLQSKMAVGLLLGCSMLVSCTFKGTVTTETLDDSDTVIIRLETEASPVKMEAEPKVLEEPQYYTREDVVGIYDTEDYDRYCFDADGTGSSGIVGSLNFTSFDYEVDGDEIIIIWGDESQTRLEIKDRGRVVYSPTDDLTYRKEE